jgi:hypothetical protein
MSSELEWAKWKEEDERFCNCQAIFLLEELQPTLWAITANATGIYIQPREQVRWLTPWERSLIGAKLRLPAVWTGYLSAMAPKRRETWKKYSNTSSSHLKLSPQDRSTERVLAAVSSQSRLLTQMQEFFFDGHPMGAESMQEKSR